MYQLERFEEHESLKEDFQQWFDDTSANWYAAWTNCNAISTFRNNEEWNRRFSDFLLSTPFENLLKEAMSKKAGHKVSFRETKFHAWCNVYEQNFFQEPHDHINSAYPIDEQPDLCFSYFFDVPDEPLFFFIEGDQQHYINEQSGTVAFFGPSQYHGVDMNPEDQPRKTVSGNLWIVKNND